MTARTALVSVIAFALTRCKAHFRAMAQSHNTDEAREAAAEIIADQILRSGFWGRTPFAVSHERQNADHDQDWSHLVLRMRGAGPVRPALLSDGYSQRRTRAW